MKLIKNKNRNPHWLLLILFLFFLPIIACSDTPVADVATNSGVSSPIQGLTQTPVASTFDNTTVKTAISANSPVALADPKKRVVLNIWTGGLATNTDTVNYFNTLFDYYNSLYPNVTFEWHDFGNELVANFEKAQAGGDLGRDALPDLVLLNTPAYFQQGFNNRLEPLNNYQEFESKRDGYNPGLLETFKLGQYNFGLPWLATTRITLVNKSLWKMAGLDTGKLPQTIDDFDAILQPLAKKTPDDVRALWLKPDPLSDFMMEGLPLFQLGTDGKSRSATFNNPLVQARWGFYSNHINDKSLVKEALDGNDQDALNRFVTGKLAVWVDGGESLALIKGQNQELYNQNLLVALQPTGKPGLLPVISKGLWAVPKFSRVENKNMAVDFASFLTNDQNQLSFAKSVNPNIYIPTTQKALSDVFVTGGTDAMGQSRKLVAGVLSNLRSPEKSLPYPLSAEARLKLVTSLSDAQKSLWQGTAPQQALSEAEKTWNEVLRLEDMK